MIEYPAFYQLGFYAPDTHKEPEPEIIGRLMRAFKDKGFIPTTVQEFQLVAERSDAGLRPGRRLQLQFTSPSQNWNLAFEEQRVLLKKVGVEDTKIGTVDDFSEEADEVFRLLLNEMQFRGTRLAFAMKGLLPEMPLETLAEAGKRLLNAVPFYVENLPCEWTANNVTRTNVSIGEKSETLNVIANVRRLQGTLQEGDNSVPIDRVEVGFDINTHQDSKEQRFGANDVSPFLKAASEISGRIFREIQERINE